MRLVSAFVLSLGMAAPSHAQEWSAEIYGGIAGSGSEDYRTTTYNVDQGTTLGFGLYYSLGTWEIGADVMSTDRTYADFANDVESVSLMANGRYIFPISTSIEGYGGIGLGLIRVGYAGTGPDEAYSGTDVVPGAQISLGARFALGSGSLFSEIKHQAALDDASIDSAADSDVPQSYKSTSVVVGYSFNF